MAFSPRTQCWLLPSDLFFNHLMGSCPPQTKAPAPWARQLHHVSKLPLSLLVGFSVQPAPPPGPESMANYPAAEPTPPPCPSTSSPSRRAPSTTGRRIWGLLTLLLCGRKSFLLSNLHSSLCAGKDFGIPLQGQKEAASLLSWV